MRHVAVQHEDFDVGAEYDRLAALRPAPGAIVTFTGIVRDFADDAEVTGLELEHYPGMTERSMEAIMDEAWQRWPLRGASAIHRIGRLGAGDQIVLVAAASDHRQAAFDAAHFLIDYLKTRAVLWKKELRGDDAVWVQSTGRDHDDAQAWQTRET